MSISLATYMTLLQKWTIQHNAFQCPLDRLKDIASPSIIFIKSANSEKSADFVMFYAVKENVVEYLDPRKGWVLEDMNEFEKKFGGVVLSAESIELREENFEFKENEYITQKLTNPSLKTVRVVDEFLTDKECEYVINLSNPLFQRSKYMIGDKVIVHEDRTSFSAELHTFDNDEILKVIRKKGSELLNIPEDHFESFQCVSYDKSQAINSHFDTFDENSEGGKKIIAAGGQRKYTMLVYLNDDFEGGSTYFPNLDLLVSPKKRRVLIFDNLDDNGKIRASAFHAGLPVASGRKYAMNMWVRTKPCK